MTHTNPFPSFLEAKNMLLLHESREDQPELTTDTHLSPSSALYSTSATNNNGKGRNKNNRGNKNTGRVASKGTPGGGGLLLSILLVFLVIQVLLVVILNSTLNFYSYCKMSCISSRLRILSSEDPIDCRCHLRLPMGDSLCHPHYMLRQLRLLMSLRLNHSSRI